MEDQSQNPSNASLSPEATPKASTKQIEPPTPSYVKRRKRRAALWILVGVTGAGVLTLGIIAFLGQNFGNFTVKLNNDEDASLQIGEVIANNDRGLPGIETPSTYLDVSGLTANRLIAESSLPSEDILDCDITRDTYDSVMWAKKDARAKLISEEEGSASGSESSESLGVYFNYTFYVRNISSEQVTYSVKYYCTENNKPSNLYDSAGNEISVELKKFVRIRVYANTYSASAAIPTITHNCTTYAYPNISSDGTPLPETVSDPRKSTELCTNFLDWKSDLFTVFDETGVLKGDEIVRYSVVMWFEGWDRDTEGVKELPRDASMAFAIDITGKKSRSLETSSSESSL